MRQVLVCAIAGIVWYVFIYNPLPVAVGVITLCLMAVAYWSGYLVGKKQGAR